MEPVLAIVGPTAVGKTTLALELAERRPVEIVNADALQVYRGFDIGTAKPTAAERERVPHHLIDILDADEAFSAGAFAERARRVIDEIQGRDRLAVVVGGSGLYLKALLEGIGTLPRSDPEIRRRLEERLEREGSEALWKELEAVDPPTAARLPPADRQRILRALEVYEMSGKPLSHWISERPFGERPLAAVKVGLTLPRAVLYDRIASRLERMIERGWVEEVAGLLERWGDPELPAFQAIGYRQLARHLQEGRPLEEAVEEIVTATRRFAKRQLTWFRSDSDIVWYRVDRTPHLPEAVLRQFERRTDESDGSSR
ncbi:MAG: tRNA (adenosine(37)-N6)-dimethylallyltransferase MiaA [Thermoanaerobaculia bacterium]|nr:tRNA (adenosine(37)-N6)-dimethylallyltransferase MiaA [Thermoanaerobaculia bacterium]